MHQNSAPETVVLVLDLLVDSTRMCSISGITPVGGIEKLIAAQTHRAPDESGVYKDELIELGMGRLKIIDLESPGLAPYQEDEFVLCYNGEIYNYLELREELKKLGWNFTTASDTEVLLKSWRQWGKDMFDKLNGMFAFAIYNTKSKKLILARDITGEKPLYYFKQGKKFAFASEAKALPTVLPLKKRQDDFFEAFQHCLFTTLWEGVHEVPPAHYMEVDIETGDAKVVEYWQFQRRDINPDTAEEELESLLEESVKLRIRSDVPIGLYFSGGVDSSIISVLHDFDHQYYFDNTDPSLKKDFFEKIPLVLKHLDFPVGSLGFFGMWKLAEKASKDVTVILSGEGADELFGGYVRYMPIAREYQLHQQFPSYEYLFSKHYGKRDFASDFARITTRNEKYTEVVRERVAPYFDMFDDPISAMGFADFKLILPSLMQMGDRMAGAFSIENRCPFLDRRIIEFGFSLPPEFKIDSKQQKVILRNIATKHGLHDAVNMEKKGMSVPYNVWQGKSGWDRSEYFNFLKEIWNQLYPDGQEPSMVGSVQTSPSLVSVSQ